MVTNAAASGPRTRWPPARQLRLVDGGVRDAGDAHGAPLPADADDAAPAGPSIDAHGAVLVLYQDEYRGIARLAYLLVGDQHRAEDLAHDAFVKLFEHWADLDDPDRAVAYLRATTANLAMSAHRRNRTRRKYAAVTEPRLADATARSAEAEALSRSARPDVVRALQRLSPKQRTAVVLKYWLRLTEGEIADSLGCSIGSVRTHLFRGHRTLGDLLGGLR